MGSYVQSTLMSGEKTTYEGKVSPWSMLPLILIGVILLPAFGVGILLFVAAYIRYVSTELAVTNKRIIAKFGLISRTTIELNLHKAESIQVQQGLLGRLFGYGSIVVAGGGNPQAPVPGISEPLEFRKAFLNAQELASAGRG